MKAIHTDHAPKAIGPYSQAIEMGSFIFTSGQIPLNPKTGEMVHGGIAAQTRQVFANLQAVLAASGASFAHVVKATVYLKEMTDFPIVNEIYAEVFGNHKPARSTVEVASLPKGALIEIDLIATKG